MTREETVSAILEGKSIKEVLAVNSAETSFDDKWKKKVQDAASQVFDDAKRLWDLFQFAPEEFDRNACQDALNVYYAWYKKFLKSDLNKEA